MSVPTVISYRIKFIVFPRGLYNILWIGMGDGRVFINGSGACKHKSHTVLDLEAYIIRIEMTIPRARGSIEQLKRALVEICS